MKNFTKMIALGAVLAASASLAHADEIGFAGQDTYAVGSSLSFVGTTFTTIDTTPSGIPAASTVITLTSPISLSSLTPGTILFTSGTTTVTLSSVLFDSLVNSNNGNVFQAGFLGILTEPGYSEKVEITITNNQSAPQNGSYTFSGDIIPAPAPEPSSLVLLGTGLASAAGMAFRKRRIVA